MDESVNFEVRYVHCGEEWVDYWSCDCNDKCPICNKEIEPASVTDLRSAAASSFSQKL